MTGSAEAPVGYTLRVAGRLDPGWSAWFDGFAITGGPDGTTTLSGTVADQAQLHQLLAKIRDLGVALLCVEAGPATSERRVREAGPQSRG